MSAANELQALVLAAGMGSRLGAHTADVPKCMVSVNDERLIDRLVGQLIKAGVGKIGIVTGYKGNILEGHLAANFGQRRFVFIHNPDYASTNNIYSLWLAADFMGRADTLLVESDLIFEQSIVNQMIIGGGKCEALVSPYLPCMDGTGVRLDREGHVIEFVKGSRIVEGKTENGESLFKTVNFYRFSKDFSQRVLIPFLQAYRSAFGENEYYEYALRLIAHADPRAIRAVEAAGRWCEIDNAADLARAEGIF